MPTAILFLVLWGLYKAARAAQRHGRRRAKAAPTASPGDALRRNLATLHALQGQRDQIEQALSWCDDLISTEDNPEKVIRWMTKKAQLRGQLATVEAKISKLTG